MPAGRQLSGLEPVRTDLIGEFHYTPCCVGPPARLLWAFERPETMLVPKPHAFQTALVPIIFSLGGGVLRARPSINWQAL
jgi:hypothetical protein